MVGYFLRESSLTGLSLGSEDLQEPNKSMLRKAFQVDKYKTLRFVLAYEAAPVKKNRCLSVFKSTCLW